MMNQAIKEHKAWAGFHFFSFFFFFVTCKLELATISILIF